MSRHQIPEFVAIGHIAKDIVPGGFAIGGTVAYASITARNLGKRAGIITCIGDDLPFEAVEEALAGIEVVQIKSPMTTTFQNIYLDGSREQYVRAIARKIQPADVPYRWRKVPIVLIGPIAQEVDEAVVDLFQDSLIGVTPQGWMRQWDERGKVHQCPWEGAHRILPKVDVLVFSEEDVKGNIEIAEEYARLTRIVVLTQAWKGATVYYQGQKRQFPARAALEVDPTGAGDVFAAAFLIHLHDSGDPWESARFANVVASFSIEKPGTKGIPERETVEEWLEKYGWP
ncbi:MAG: ribokinase [Chloroflexi bacterium]|nr:MAG: ribokinase [Chloroflexota bacterium]HDN79660.1 ribokinase [Chloroflexota bacterium]